MLVIGRAGHWLVERRPPTGIWGGLWSLPQSDPREGLEEEGEHAFVDRIATRHGLRIEGFTVLPTVLHAFTHFRLRILPLLAHSVDANGVACPGAIWLPVADVSGAALPQPVKRLLQQLSPSPVR